MNSINLTGEVKWVKYTTESGEDTVVEVINSPTINHQLLSMTYAYNYDEEIEPLQVIDLEGLDPSLLGIKELAAMNKVLVMQSSSEEADNKFEFKSLLDSNSITTIDLPKHIALVEFYDYNWNLVSSIDFESMGEYYLNSRKLFILTYSANQINNVSPEIHEKMIHPHKDVKTLILTISDIDEMQQVEDLIKNYIFLPTNTLLGDKDEAYETDMAEGEFADTKYILGVRSGDNIHAVINFKEIEL
jgi:hypothetical protein